MVAGVVIGAVLFTSSDHSDATPAHRAEFLYVGRERLRILRAGDGPLIVLVHGYSESLLAWRGIVDRLTDDAEVVALDLPGHGLSSKPGNGYTVDSLAANLLATLDTLRARRVVLVGHSMGGAVVAAAALAAPERVRGIVLVDPASVTMPWMLPDSLADSSTAATGVRSAIAEMLANRTRLMPVHDPGWLSEEPTNARYNPADDPAHATALRSILEAFDFGYLTEARAAMLRVPVLLIWGDYDPLIPAENGRRLQTVIPGSRLVVIPRSWHRPHVEHPDTVAAEIRHFMAELSPDSP